jgi:polyisoprenoid-binding protein YceI
MRLAAFYFVAFTILSTLGGAQVPVFEFSHEESSIKFHVKASVDLTGAFDKWDASLKFSSPAAESGVLEVKIQAASGNTGSGMKDGKLKSKDFFNVKENPLITFVSKKLNRSAQTALICWVILRYAESLNLRP